MTKKDVIYLDTEDDITATIDKVKASQAGIIAVVPPKRANMLASVVNLKLLKRAATLSEKKVVLITDEEVLTSMAGGIGMFVARDLKTAPTIPRVDNVELPSNVIEPKTSNVTQAKPVSTKKSSEPINAGKMAVAETAQIPDKLADTPEEAKKVAKSKSSKIPNISKFRKKIFIGIGIIILLILAWWWAFFIAPSADVTLKASSTEIPFEKNVSLSSQPGAKLDTDSNIIPAQIQELSEEAKQEYRASGEKNVGKAASGSVTLSNASDSSSVTFPAGSRLTAAEGKTFTSNSSVTVPGASVLGGAIVPGRAKVGVSATDKGESFNIAAQSYTTSKSGISADGGTMSGGTDDIVKVVEQSDIDEAASKITDKGKGEVEALNELKSKFTNDGLIVIDDSFKTEAGKPTASAPTGTQADGGTVTATVKYRLLAIKTEDYKAYLDAVTKEDVDEGQKLIDYDEKNVVFTAGDGNVFTLKATIKSGPDVNLEELKKELIKAKFSEAVKTAESKPGIKEAKIDLSPFWVFSMPRNANKIDIKIVSP
ncbi:hypothetical protein KBF61_04125 [Candidatus Saccharibacteria bacterium]|nr:hypothetical protein [Candidatus Saccharibacteria bacterium]